MTRDEILKQIEALNAGTDKSLTESAKSGMLENFQHQLGQIERVRTQLQQGLPVSPSSILNYSLQNDPSLNLEKIVRPGEAPGTFSYRLAGVTPQEVHPYEQKGEIYRGALPAGFSPYGTAPKSPAEKPIPIEPSTSFITVGMTNMALPNFPAPTTVADTKTYTEIAIKDLENKKQQTLDAYNIQLKAAQEHKDAAEKNITDLETKQAVMLETDMQPLLQPFREAKRKAERERLKVEEKYFANETLINELDGLLTNLQAEVASAEAQTGLASIRNPRIAKLKEDVASRVGIIEAVMSARTGQIHEAYTLINQSIDDITKDRQDQLAYYKAVYDFYGEQKDSEGKKLIQLTKDEKDFIDGQITFLESEAKIAQENVDYIKDLLVNPDTATAMARAGITLGMTIPEMNKALADDGYRQEVIKISNDAADDGFQYLATPEQIRLKQADPTAEVRIMTDAKGKTYAYWKEKKAEVIKVEIYDEKTIPSTLRQDIIDTLTDEKGAKDLGRELTIPDLIKIFPNVGRELLADYLDKFYNYEELIKEEAPTEETPTGETTKSWWQFWK